MNEFPAIRNRNRSPTHPGALLRDTVLPSLNIKISPAAKILGVSRQTLHKILEGKAPVSTVMALRVGKFCGNGPDLWINMQSAYDLWHLSREMAEELEKIPTKHAA